MADVHADPRSQDDASWSRLGLRQAFCRKHGVKHYGERAVHGRLGCCVFLKALWRPARCSTRHRSIHMHHTATSCSQSSH